MFTYKYTLLSVFYNYIRSGEFLLLYWIYIYSAGHMCGSKWISLESSRLLKWKLICGYYNEICICFECLQEFCTSRLTSSIAEIKLCVELLDMIPEIYIYYIILGNRFNSSDTPKRGRKVTLGIEVDTRVTDSRLETSHQCTSSNFWLQQDGVLPQYGRIVGIT